MKLDAAALTGAIAEAAELVSDGDLAITALTLQFATAVLRHQPGAAATVTGKVRCYGPRQ